MGRGLVGHLLHHTLEQLTRMHDLRALERLERRTPLDPGAMRRQQRIERFERLAALGAAHLGGKSVSSPRLRFDVDGAVRLPEQPPQ